MVSTHRAPRATPLPPLAFAGERVLDVGTFDGFYTFLAEHRGAANVRSGARSSPFTREQRVGTARVAPTLA